MEMLEAALALLCAVGAGSLLWLLFETGMNELDRVLGGGAVKIWRPVCVSWPGCAGRGCSEARR